MESNRDAADQCYAKAVAALKVGDVDKARRMAEKSIRLFETSRATEFLEVCIVNDCSILIPNLATQNHKYATKNRKTRPRKCSSTEAKSRTVRR